jgi:hypothetical protein
MIWAWFMLACQGTGVTDSATDSATFGPAWTQVYLTCSNINHSWTAYATGLHGHASLRLVPAEPTGVYESHPMVVQVADPGGTWTLFALELTVDITDPTTIPGRVSAHDCRNKGVDWTWAVDLLDDDRVVACAAWEATDTGAGPEQVATCDQAK